ncbi:hypothetical protein [Actinomadura sp. 7K507]|uniref:hypothetical protein n=1 Tax=Actinomadura sp. 7K507 TaxID=2530365 RepID=UPI001A9E6FE8|nr:hypothetical protein [Actinomadura sp. 7K507]
MLRPGLLGRRTEPVVGRTGLRHPVLVLRLVLRFALLVLVLRRRVLLILRWRVLLVLRLVLVGHRRLLLRRLRPAPRVLLRLLLRLLGHVPRIPGRLLLRHRRLAAPVLGLPSLLMVLRLAVLGLPLLGLPVLRLPLLGLPVLRLPLLGLVGYGRRAPRVLLLSRLLLLRRAPRVLRGAGRTRRLVRGLLLGGLLLVGVVLLRRLLVRLTVLRRGAVGLTTLLRPLRRVSLPLLVVVPARRLPVGAAAGAGQVGPAAHAEQVARLERLVTDRTVQGRHDTSPERTPARSSLDVR